MAWYKVANGPLTIANSPINVTVEDESDSTEVVECSASDWIDNSSNMVESGNAYMLKKQDSLDNYFYVYVLDDATLNSDWSVSQGAEVPMSGIFVSENVRGIAIQAHAIYHKVPAEYLQLEPLIVTITGDDQNGYTANRSISEIVTAVNNGREVFAELGMDRCFLSAMDTSGEYVLFSESYIHNEGEFTFNGSQYSGPYVVKTEIQLWDENGITGVWVQNVPIPCGSFSSNGGGGEEAI